MDAAQPRAMEMLPGRTGALTTLASLLRSQPDGAFVATVTGLPGVGKSTLVATAVTERAQRGTASLVVPLAGADDPLGVADAVLSRLPPRAGLSTSVPEALWEAYDGASLLLVLEDVDRVQGLSGLLAGLADGYPAATVVCTAVRPTRAPGERLVRLAPLPLPTDDAPADDPTIALFAARAAAHGIELDLADPTVRRQVAQACRRTGGLPGVIDLAAARLDTVPLAVMARALATPTFRVLRSSDGHDGTVETALEWTFDLLTKPARRTLVQASVFEGPFLLDAAVAVIDPDGSGVASAQQLADLLMELVDDHLLDIDPDGSGEPRFLVAEFVRGFARRHLGADETGAAVRARHAAYFRDRGRSGADVVRREWPDIVAALDHHIADHDLDDALEVAVSLAPMVRELPGATVVVQERMAGLLARDHPLPDALRARALVWSSAGYPDGVGEDQHRVATWTSARVAEAISAARESGDGPALLEALEMAITALRITMDMTTAVAAAHEGLELARRLDDQGAIARFEAWTSMAVRLSGDSEESIQLATAAVVRGREHGEAIAVIHGTHILYDAPAELRPSLDPPLSDLETLLTECERVEHPYAAMAVLASLARERSAQGDLPGAARWLWRLLMLAANRQRTQPVATLGGVATLMSVALATGSEDDAVRLRESVVALEPFLPYCLPPLAAEAYRRDVATLVARLGEDRYRLLAAEVEGISVAEANRRAQAVARELAGHHPPTPAEPTTSRAGLTPREHEVLRALATGMTNRQIADAMGVSTKTVMHHSVAIYRKIGVRGRAGATAWAFHHGLAPEGDPP